MFLDLFYGLRTEGVPVAIQRNTEITARAGARNRFDAAYHGFHGLLGLHGSEIWAEKPLLRVIR